MTISHDQCMKSCIKPLIKELLSRGFVIDGELTNTGWVNIHCKKCRCTHEVDMHGRFDDETSDQCEPEVSQG